MNANVKDAFLIGVVALLVLTPTCALVMETGWLRGQGALVEDLTLQVELLSNHIYDLDSALVLVSQGSTQSGLTISGVSSGTTIWHGELVYWLDGYVVNSSDHNASVKVLGVFFNSKGSLLVTQAANVYSGPFGDQSPVLPGKSGFFTMYIFESSIVGEISSYSLLII